jgi:putative hydrolase of the HAD superfamily
MNAAARTPRVVCFDWGGVILRHCRSWDEACAAAGLDVREGVHDPELVGLRRIASRAYQCGRVECDAFFEMLAFATGGLYSEAECRRLHDAWLISEYAGVGAVIDELEARGVATALLSNTNATHWSRMAPGGGAMGGGAMGGGAAGRGGGPHFPTAARTRIRMASHLVGLAKPDASIYAAFERISGATAGEIVFFDDVRENVEAARERGWRAVEVDHTRETEPQIRGALVEMGVLAG